MKSVNGGGCYGETRGNASFHTTAAKLTVTADDFGRMGRP
jgi:hypothetical protein